MMKHIRHESNSPRNKYLQVVFITLPISSEASASLPANKQPLDQLQPRIAVVKRRACVQNLRQIELYCGAVCH